MIFNFPKHRSGDTWRGISTITIVENETPIDLTGCKIYIQFRSIYNLASPVVLLLSTDNNTVNILVPTLGIISIPEQIVNVPTGIYRYDLQIDFPNGESKTFLEGEWEIIPGITTPNFDTTVNSRYNSLKINSLISLVSANSAMWGYMATDIKDLTGNWQNTYTAVRDNSANWSLNTIIKELSSFWGYQGTDIKDLTGNWQNTYTIVQNNSSSWAIDALVRSLSGYWQNSYTITSTNSSNWNSVYTSVNPVSSNWDSVYTSVKDTSANWNSVYSSVNPVSSNWDTVYTSVLNTSANWDTVYTSVLNTSANWDSVYTSVKDTSANWDTVYTSVLNTSANWDTVYTSVLNTSANWDSVYSSVNSVSSNWNTVYTSVKDTSANWNTVYTSVKDTSANWDSVYSSVNSVSSNWNSVYTSVKDTSGKWDSVYTSVKDTSGNWDSVYTTYNKNSATYATIEFANNKFLPLSGGKIDGDLVITGDLSILGASTIIETNISTTSALQVTNNGTDIALTVTQNGNSDVAKFIDDGNTVLVLKNGGNVGINTETPNVELTVNGSISSNSVIYDKVGNSNQWNSVYSTVSVNSALNWVQGTELRNLSGHWESSYTTVLENSSKWLSDFSITQEFFDDFLTLGPASTLPLSFLKPANIGGAIFVSPENSKQGVLILSTNPLLSANQRSAVTSNATIHLGQGSEYRLIFSARKGTSSFSDSVSGIIDMGFHSDLATNSQYPDNGCFFTSVNGGNWIAHTVTESSIPQTTDTGIPCDTTWRTFEIKINFDSTEVQYYINNLLVAVHTQSIPKDNGTQTAIGYRCLRKTISALNVELRLDWQSLIIKRNNKLWN